MLSRKFVFSLAKSAAAVVLAATVLTGCTGARGPAAASTSAAPAARQSATEQRIARLEARLAAAEQNQALAMSERERLERINEQLSRIVGALQRIEPGVVAAAAQGTAATTGTAPATPSAAQTAAPPQTSAAPSAESSAKSTSSTSSMPSTAAPAALAGPAADSSETGPLVKRSEAYQFQGPTTEWRGMVGDLSKQFTESPKLESASARPDLIGKPLPQSRFIGPDGSIVDLADFAGRKRVVLVFMRGFAGAVCPTCSAQTIALTHSVKEFENRDAHVILVYPGAAESIPAFLDSIKVYEEQSKLPYPVLLDVNLGAVKAFDIAGALAKPTSIVIDKAGKVQFAYVGQRPDDRPSVKTLLAELDRVGG